MKNTVEEIGLIHRDSTFYRKGNMALRFYLPIEICFKWRNSDLKSCNTAALCRKFTSLRRCFPFPHFLTQFTGKKTKENEIKKKSISDEIKKETAPHRGKRCFSFKICIYKMHCKEVRFGWKKKKRKQKLKTTFLSRSTHEHVNAHEEHCFAHHRHAHEY